MIPSELEIQDCDENEYNQIGSSRGGECGIVFESPARFILQPSIDVGEGRGNERKEGRRCESGDRNKSIDSAVTSFTV